MDALIQTINMYRDQILLVANAIILLVAVAFIAYNIVKALMASKDKKMNDMAKHVGIAVLVAFIAAIGVAGVVSFMNMIAPSDGSLIQLTNRW